jgi:PAS domain S-box-containing protein
MKSATLTHKLSNVPEFLSGGGELGQRIREYDWSKTPLGPVETWPQSLRTCVRIMLTSRQPIWIGWGKDLIKLYNDPYKAIVGGKHPWALGKPASVVWKDIWKDIEPMLKQVMEKDEGTYVESQLLIMERNGYPEETYYTFSYTPIPGDDGKTAGMFCANTDDTDRIISERQLRTLTQLGQRLADCKFNQEIIEKTIATLQENPQDFPFAFFRTIEENKAVLVHSTPLGNAAKLIPTEVDLNTNNDIAVVIKKVMATRKPQVFEDLSAKLGGTLPTGAWEVPPKHGIVLPIIQSGLKEPYCLLMVGLNPYRLLDEKYLGFFSLVADQVATSFADVHALEEERKRAEALAEIDRAKTLFFSNISHEFRTPLTLLLGPIEDALNDTATHPENKVRMDIAYRNGLRMQKLVNTLLEFSRIEAGRMEGKFSKVDICSFTEELASTFRSAIEKAGMELVFHCNNVQGDVYVDVDMWEKIVLNLLSNAFKYSKEGRIEVQITEADSQIHLAITDTGIGIPEDQLDKIFERFHRIENTQGRSQEGTGIGLAMVKELVKLHNGSMRVKSKVGKGSTFIISLPTGKEHLPAEKITGTINQGVSRAADAFVHEALRWLPENEVALNDIINGSSDESLDNFNALEKKYTVLLADDNADLRGYIQRLLTTHHQVITAVDGEDAFQKLLRYKPDLLLSDVMMPKLDGFGLLNRVRAYPDTKNIPVIFLSARAGEEAKVEGLEAGADDYLVKPFSAKELLARVDANIKIAKNRIATENNLRNFIRQSPVASTLLQGPSFIIEIVNERGLEIWGRSYDEVINKPLGEALPEVAAQGFVQLLTTVYTTGVAYRGNETPVELMRFGKPETVYLNFIYEPLRNEYNEVTGIIAVGVDVSEQVIARKKIEQSQKELIEMANAVPQLVWVANAKGEITYYNNRIAEFAGAGQAGDGQWYWADLIHPDDLEATEKAWSTAIQNGSIYQIEHRVQMKDGSYKWFLSRTLPHKDEEGNIIKWFGTATDIHASKEQATILEEEVKKRTAELKELNTSLQQSNQELQQFAHVASHDLKEPLRKIRTFTGRLAHDPENLFSEKSKTYLEKINTATDRMSAMIEGVLNYSVLNANEQCIEPVDLNEILKNIEADLELLIAEKEARLQYEKLPVIEGSSVLLYQLFYNMVNNSLKFSRPGTPPLIRITATEDNDKARTRIRIDDNGIGFEQEYAERIFESFTRLNSKDQFEGTGLGLSLCKRIAERHGGHIQAEGRPGVGARFIITLPLTQSCQRI